MSMSLLQVSSGQGVYEQETDEALGHIEVAFEDTANDCRSFDFRFSDTFGDATPNGCAK